MSPNIIDESFCAKSVSRESDTGCNIFRTAVVETIKDRASKEGHATAYFYHELKSGRSMTASDMFVSWIK